MDEFWIVTTSTMVSKTSHLTFGDFGEFAYLFGVLLTHAKHVWLVVEPTL